MWDPHQKHVSDTVAAVYSKCMSTVYSEKIIISVIFATKLLVDTQI